VPDDEPPSAPPDLNPFVVAPVSAAAAAEALQAAPPAAESPQAVPPADEAPRTGPPAEAPGQAPAPPAGPAATPRDGFIDLALDGDAPRTEMQAGAAPAPEAGGGFEDPFAGWKPFEGEEGPGVVPPPLPTRARGPVRERPAERIAGAPAPPRPGTARKVGTGPKMFLAGGAAAVVVIAVVVLATGKGGGGQVEPAAPSAAPSAGTAPVRPAEAPTPAPPVPAPAASEAPPAPSASAEQPGLDLTAAEQAPKRRAAESRPKRERPARVAKEERPAEPEPALPAPAPARPAAAVSAASQPAPAANGPPSADKVARIVNANGKAFEACVAEAARRDPSLELGGRQVVLMLTVNPNGMVTNPTIDDGELDKTDLGGCLKSAARLMVFPAFEGAPMKVEVPLALGGGG
jgi:hypothetical protein